MATIYHTSHIKKVIGAHSKDGLVERQKHFFDYDGNLTKVGKLEGYIPNPRNYVANPITPGEHANQQAFGNNSHQAQEFIDAWKNNTPLPEKKQAFLDEIKARFRAQLNGNPDRIAKPDKLGNYHPYVRPDNFIRAVLLTEHPTFDYPHNRCSVLGICDVEYDSFHCVGYYPTTKRESANGCR